MSHANNRAHTVISPSPRHQRRVVVELLVDVVFDHLLGLSDASGPAQNPLDSRPRESLHGPAAATLADRAHRDGEMP